MIRLSRFGRRLLFVACGLMAPAEALSVNACTTEHSCTTIGCLDGLNLRLEGAFLPGKTYELEVSSVSDGDQAASLMLCTVTAPAAGSAGGNAGLTTSCTSALAHVNVGNLIQIQDTTLKQVRVSVSLDGVPVGEQAFQATYQSREINGPGCGVCTSANESITIP